ncbi:MAG: hypothetical protein M3Q23_04120 [Actinomycetota bacterium]|nr:hypothetical protein [Actinomycetota bacterium]
MADVTFEGLARSSIRELEPVLREGAAPDAASLTGSEWRGFNVGLKMRLLGAQKFRKGFFAGPDGIEGYNTPVRQGGKGGPGGRGVPGGPWTPKPSPERPKRFGFFLVKPVAPGGRDSRYPKALLLDYGASPRNPPRSPTRPIRDYLVQPDPGNPDLMLGKGYMALGGLRLFPQFFVIERLDDAAWTP